MWRNCNTWALLVGMSNRAGDATIGNGMDRPQKVKIELAHDPVIPPLNIQSKQYKTVSQR